MYRPVLAFLLCLIATACGTPAAAQPADVSPPVPAIGTLAPATLAVAASTGPTPTATLSSDPRLRDCRADAATAATVVPLGHTFDYRRVLPSLGFSAALDALDGPALLVVYGGMSPLRSPITVYPPNGGPAVTFPQPALPPGTSDVCVAVDGVAKPFLFEAIAATPIHHELADAARQPPAPGEARVVAAVGGLDLAWDPVHRLVWTVTMANWRGTLSAVDPVTGQARRWNLPTALALQFPSATGSSFSIAVDAEGGVWFEASGYNLYRFDLATQAFRAVHLDLKTGHWRTTGSYVLAIVPYGNGVLVARRGVPILYRYDASVRVVGSVPVGRIYDVTREVTRAGSNIVIRGGKWLGLFDIHGRRIRQLLYSPGCTASVEPHMTSDDRRRAVICDGDQLLLLDQEGRAVGHVTPAVDLPTEPLVYPRQSERSVGPWATDWQGRWWYAIDGYLVQVNAE